MIVEQGVFFVRGPTVTFIRLNVHVHEILYIENEQLYGSRVSYKITRVPVRLALALGCNKFISYQLWRLLFLI